MFQRLAEVAEVSALSKEERIKYDHALKRYRDTLNAMTGAEMKGRTEGQTEIVRNMRAQGLSAEDDGAGEGAFHDRAHSAPAERF